MRDLIEVFKIIIDWFYYHAANNAVPVLCIQFVNSNGLTQFVNQSTCNNNILDLVLCSSSSFVLDINDLPPNSTSDHDAILFRPNISTVINMSHNEMHYAFYDYVHADHDSLNNYLLAVDRSAQFQYCFGVNQCWSTCCKILKNIIFLLRLIYSFLK